MWSCVRYACARGRVCVHESTRAGTWTTLELTLEFTVCYDAATGLALIL